MSALADARRHLAANRPQAAAAVLGRYLEAHPDDPEAWRLAAAAAHADGERVGERRALERVLALDGRDATSWRRMGVRHLVDGNVADAVRALRRAVALDPEDGAAHGALARALFARRDLAGLEHQLSRLRQAFPEQLETDLLAGHAAKALGDVDRARTAYLRAAAAHPRSGEVLYNLVDLAPGAVDERLRSRLRTLCEDAATDTADRVNAEFAEARLREQEGDVEGAFAYYARANGRAREALTRRGLRWDGDALEARLARERERGSLPPRDAGAPRVPMPITPIFVIGPPRSGTTLVERILGSHAAVQAAGELPLGPRIHAEATARSELDAAALDAAREAYVEGLFARGFDGPFVVDKLPANWEIAGFLRLVFPEAPIVSVRRDPRATAWSLFTANFAAHEPWVHDLETIAAVLRAAARQQDHWRATLAPPFAELRYEALVANPEPRIRRLLEELGLPFDPAVLHSETLDAPVFTASHRGVRVPIHDRARDRWRPWADRLRGLDPQS